MQYPECLEENNNRYGLVCYTIPGVSGTIKKIVTGYALVCYAIAEVSGKNKTG